MYYRFERHCGLWSSIAVVTMGATFFRGSPWYYGRERNMDNLSVTTIRVAPDSVQDLMYAIY
jgi:hypothetical protein